MWLWWIGGAVGMLLVVTASFDLMQRKHAILRNFPIIGHFRYLLELIGPELRQYIVTNNDEERPFSRDQRRWVYASAKKENNYFGFGSDNEMQQDNYLILKQDTFPLAAAHSGDANYDPQYRIPCAKMLGGHRRRAKAFRPASVVNLSAMSFGSLSAAAVAAINRGCATAECLHNTGEGGISPHHLHGGELIWQIGTGYFGCRETDGTFSLAALKENVARHPSVRAIEIKLSQGAKAGLGGIVPAAKVTREISQIRGVPMGRDCLSPPLHSAFRDADGLLDFVEQIAAETGLPVGIKSAVGQLGFWSDLARLMVSTDRGVDFITIDGGEGGTGAAPLAFADHVSLPFTLGFSRVYRTLAEHGLHQNLVLIGSAKLGFPASAFFAFALGCDMIGVAREGMLAIGCIQAQRCHTGHCPTGVATQNRWLMRGLDPTSKAARLANYVVTLRKELLMLSRACGAVHPGFITGEHLEILDGRFNAQTIAEIFGYQDGYGLPAPDDLAAVERAMQSH